jgi:ATP-dependent RNA helicase DDX27
LTPLATLHVKKSSQSIRLDKQDCGVDTSGMYPGCVLDGCRFDSIQDWVCRSAYYSRFAFHVTFASARFTVVCSPVRLARSPSHRFSILRIEPIETESNQSKLHSTMATLLPSLSSDEEDNAITTQESHQHDDDDCSSSGDEIDQDLEFGGILGEDGGIMSLAAVGWSYDKALEMLKRNDGVSSSVPRMDVSSLIDAKRKAINKSNKKKASDQEEESGDEEAKSGGSAGESNSSSSKDSDSESDSSEEEDAVEETAIDLETDLLKTRAGGGGDDEEEEEVSDDKEDEEEAAKAAAYFETHKPSGPDNEIEVFSQLTLSRPLLRGVAAMGFVRPTAIQASVIPVALAGRDVCASAVTGSGKTAAFALPILERLLQRRLGGATKALILTPTRELAAQCLGMLTTLSQFTKIQAALVVGGAKNVNAQAAELRARPDVVVATPGRLLDHVTNSPGVTLDDVEFLVLDEADRLLDLGFSEEVHEIIKACPIQRQTMLFSATMTTKVDDLVKLSLKRPVRVRISEKLQSNGGKGVEVAPRLEQEFVRVRSGNEGINREAMLLSLLTRTFTRKAIVFFDTKCSAHRMMILCGLCGIKCSELHGNLTQAQRLTALEQFRKGEVDVLLATDLAARGLDIDRVQTVINAEMPNQLETYIHRIGRTARRGRGGRSCTLIGEGRRHLMKEVIKDAEEKSKLENGKGSQTFKSGVIRSRTIPPSVVAHFVAKIKSLEPHVEEVLQAEAVARMDRLAEMEAVKAQNLIEHAGEIKSRPQREWFASNRQKQTTKAASLEKQKMIAEKAGTGTHRMTRKKRRTREAKEDLMRHQEEMQKDQEEKGLQPKKLATEKRIKSKARAMKKRDELKSRNIGSESIDDDDHPFRFKGGEARAKKTRKTGAFGSDFLGDSSLFEEERVTSSSKKSADEKRPSTFRFKERDPSKFNKKGKKKSVHSFKSKSKYKRRK